MLKENYELYDKFGRDGIFIILLIVVDLLLIKNC